MDSRIFTLASALLFGRYTGLKMRDQCDMSFNCALQNILSGVRSDVCGSRLLFIQLIKTTRTKRRFLQLFC
jgi:hypothetical protein